MSTLILRPNSDDTVQQTLSTGSDAYALVDEVVNDKSDYCQGTGAYKLNLYGFPNHTDELGTISKVVLIGGIDKQATDVIANCKMAIKISGSVYYSDEYPVYYAPLSDPLTGAATYLVKKTWTNNPNTESAWSWSDIDDLVAGCSLYTNSTGWCRNYQFYVEVTYSAPPTVTTQACTLVTQTTATLNGTVTESESTVTRRGFVGMAGTSGDPTIGGAGCVNFYEDGSWEVGTFYKNVTGLTENTDYRARAYAINSGGTSYGSTVSLKTLGAGFFLLF